MRVYHNEFGLDKNYIDGKYTQKMINTVRTLTQNYKTAQDTYLKLFIELNNSGNLNPGDYFNNIPLGDHAREIGYMLEHYVVGLGGMFEYSPELTDFWEEK